MEYRLIFKTHLPPLWCLFLGETVPLENLEMFERMGVSFPT